MPERVVFVTNGALGYNIGNTKGDEFGKNLAYKDKDQFHHLRPLRN